MKRVIKVGCVAIISAILTPNAVADEWNRKTKVTLARPVETPGVHLPGWSVLPAGSYVFRVLESASNRHIVQILNEDETIVYTTVLAIPNYRLQATDKTVITYTERPVGQPQVLRAWFYPGRSWGEEFVYPKAKAIELAQTANLPVLFTPIDIPSELPEPVTSPDAPLILDLKRALVMVYKPTGEEVQLAEAVTPPLADIEAAPQATAPETAAVNPPRQMRALPDTASPVPLIGLLGFIALAESYAAHARARRLR